MGWENLSRNSPFFGFDMSLVPFFLFQDPPDFFLVPFNPILLSYVLVNVLVSLIYCHFLISSPGKYFSFLRDVRLGGGGHLGQFINHGGVRGDSSEGDGLFRGGHDAVE